MECVDEKMRIRSEEEAEVGRNTDQEKWVQFGQAGPLDQVQYAEHRV